MESGRRRVTEEYLAGLVAALQLLESNGESRRAYGEPVHEKVSAKRPDSRVVQAALHLLFTRVNGRAAAKKELRSCWPIAESTQQKEFKAVMHTWVKALGAAGRLPGTAVQFFPTAYQAFGGRTVELLFHLAMLALETELERRYPQLLAAPAPGLQVQDAAPAAFDLALAEEHFRGQQERQRCRELLVTVQHVQLLFAASTRQAGEALQSQLRPWWPASQAHAERVQAIQQHLQGVPPAELAEASAAGALDALLRPAPAALRAQDGLGGVGVNDANPAAVAQVLEARLGAAEQPAGEDWADLTSWLAEQQFYLRALALEAGAAMAAGGSSSCSSSSAGTPCSVLQFLPPSPPRPNPILEALRSGSGGSSSAGSPAALPSWSDAFSGSSMSSSVQDARRAVWMAVRSRQAAEPPQEQAAAPLGSASLGSLALAFTPPPPVRLHSPAAPPGAGEQGAAAVAPSQRSGSRLRSGLSALPSPTLNQMIESAIGSPFLLTPISIGGGSEGAISGEDGFSLPPSLPLTPCAARVGEAAAAQQRQLQQQQPDSPCFAESIASFSVLAGGAGSAAEARRALPVVAAAGSRLRPVGEGLSPTASAAASAAVPVMASRRAGSSAGSFAAPQSEPSKASGSSGCAGEPVHPAAAPPQPSLLALGAALDEAATPESRAPLRQHAGKGSGGHQDACSPCSLAIPEQPAGAAAAAEEHGAGSQLTGFSPPRPINDSPMLPSRPEPCLFGSAGERGAATAAAAPAASIAGLQQRLARFALAKAAAAAASAEQQQKLQHDQPAGKAQQDAAIPDSDMIGAVHKRPAGVATASSLAKPSPLELPLPGSPLISQASLYSPPKALASPAGSILSSRLGQENQQDVPSARAPAPAKSDLSGMLQRFEKLKLKHKH